MYSTRRSKIRKGELGLQTPGIQHQTGLPGSQTVRETLGLKGLRNQSGSRQASRFWEEFLQDGWNDRAPSQVRIYWEELYTNEGSLGSGFIFLFLKKKEKGERWGNNDLQGRQNTVEKKDSPRSSRAGTPKHLCSHNEDRETDQSRTTPGWAKGERACGRWSTAKLSSPREGSRETGPNAENKLCCNVSYLGPWTQNAEE